jgi:glutamine synthetase
MTEVLSPDGTPHPTNTRAPLAALIDDKVEKEAPLFGFEQVGVEGGRMGCRGR